MPASPIASFGENCRIGRDLLENVGFEELLLVIMNHALLDSEMTGYLPSGPSLN
jgi:hypothetical protein